MQDKITRANQVHKHSFIQKLRELTSNQQFKQSMGLNLVHEAEEGHRGKHNCNAARQVHIHTIND